MDENQIMSAKLEENVYFTVKKQPDGQYFFSLLTNPENGGTARAYGICGRQELQNVREMIDKTLET